MAKKPKKPKAPKTQEVSRTGTVSEVGQLGLRNKIDFMFTCPEGELEVVAKATVPGVELLREGAAVTLVWRGTEWQDGLDEVDAVRIEPRRAARPFYSPRQALHRGVSTLVRRVR